MENEIKNIFQEASDKAKKLNDGIKTYKDASGAYRCRKCGEIVKNIKYFKSPAMLKVYPHGMEVWCICKCREEERRSIKAEIAMLERQAEMPRYRAGCFKSPIMAEMTFERDDSPNSEAGKLSRRWVAHYAKNVISGNIKWLFMYGGYGTGKSFYAACIANAMIERGYDVRMGTAADFEAELSAAQDKAAAYKKLAAYDVLILDDFAAERKSDYMFEVITNIVNDRYNARKAMIFTTNMSTAETGNPKDNRLRRIMSRVWEMGYPIELSGEDRRKKNWARSIK